jgi:hypothetical protein
VDRGPENRVDAGFAHGHGIFLGHGDILASR